ncbi:MAG: hypothetical protein ACYCV4_10200, partial [Dermatophilaceae bacterium]
MQTVRLSNNGLPLMPSAVRRVLPRPTVVLRWTSSASFNGEPSAGQRHRLTTLYAALRPLPGQRPCQGRALACPNRLEPRYVEPVAGRSSSSCDNVSKAMMVFSSLGDTSPPSGFVHSMAGEERAVARWAGRTLPVWRRAPSASPPPTTPLSSSRRQRAGLVGFARRANTGYAGSYAARSRHSSHHSSRYSLRA